tara:strand:- start:349 stop:606 length:258 start_codon:yes stop_codon:yes gene_type:complete
MIGSRKYTKQIISSDRSTSKIIQESESKEEINNVNGEIIELNRKIENNKDRDNSVLRVLTDLNNQIRVLKKDVADLKKQVTELKK